MNKTVIVMAGAAALLDAFVRKGVFNAVVFIIVGTASLYFGFKLFGQNKIGGVVAMLVGLELLIFGFVGQITQYGAAHIVISTILGLILIIAPFISRYLKD